MAVKAIADAPCPPPNLAPEVAASIDCAAMARFKDAVAYVPRPIMAALPAEVDLRRHGLTGPVRDQAQVGACAGFAMAAALDNAVRLRGGGEPVSSLHVFSHYGLDVQRTYFSESLLGKPITAERVWPYDPVRACRFASGNTAEGCGYDYGVTPGSAPADPALMNEKRIADQGGQIQIVGYEELTTDPVDPDQIALILASGEVLWASIAFNTSAWSSLNDRGGDRLPYYPVAASEINHGVTLEGYRHVPGLGRQFLFHNSWGTTWGRGGYAWIDEPMLRTHLSTAYRVLAGPPGSPVVAAPTSCAGAFLGICGLPPGQMPNVDLRGLPPLPDLRELPNLFPRLR